MKRLACLICIGMTGLSSPARAEFDAKRLWVNAGFYSTHFDTDQGLRNANSSYVGAYYQPWTFAGVKLGVVAGAFNGYPKAFNGGWFPAVLPVATLESGNFGLNVALVPPMKDRLYGAVSFQLKFRFQD